MARPSGPGRLLLLAGSVTAAWLCFAQRDGGFAVAKAAKAATAVTLEPPKRAQCSYMLWLAETRPALTKSLGTAASVPAVGKAAGVAWGKLDAKKKAPYVQQAEAAKADYEKKLEAFKALGGVIAPRKAKGDKKVKAPKDPNKPKRSLSSYLLWLADSRATIVKSLPKDHKATEVLVEAGKQWGALSAAKKAPFETKAVKLKEAYVKAMAAYKP